MPRKSSRKNKKVLFDPFARLCTHTITTQIGNNAGSASIRNNKSTRSRKSVVANRNSVSPSTTNANTGISNNNNTTNTTTNNNNNEIINDADDSLAAEFDDAQLTITPALSRTEVSLRVQFRLVVPLMQNDIITIYLPGFRGGPATYFSLDPIANPEKVNYASCLHAYWSGCDAKHPSGGKYGKKGIPPKQTITLRVTHSIIDNSLIVFAVPLSLSLISPDKLPANSFKIKIEGKVIQSAEGGKIHRQPFLTCTEIKKLNIVDELAVYDAHIDELCTSAKLTSEERVIALEQLTEAELDQLIERTCTQIQTYPMSMSWSLLAPLFHSYEEIGGFVQIVVECAVNHIKAHDPLSMYKEIARNWSVKVSAVIAFAELLQLKTSGLYRGLSPNALLASRVLTMEPVDVARLFTVTELPSTSLLRELQSALRVYSITQEQISSGKECLGNNNVNNKDDDINNNNNSNNNNNTTSIISRDSTTQNGMSTTTTNKNNNVSNTSNNISTMEPTNVMLTRCKSIVSKWSATLVALLTACVPVENDFSNNNSSNNNNNNCSTKAEGTWSRNKSSKRGGSAGNANNTTTNMHRPSVRFAVNSTTSPNAASGANDNTTNNTNNNDNNNFASGTNDLGLDNNIINSFDNQEESVAHAVVCPAPTSLYFGYYDLPSREVEYIKALKPETWYVLSNFTVAREHCPVEKRILQFHSSNRSKSHDTHNPLEHNVNPLEYEHEEHEQPNMNNRVSLSSETEKQQQETIATTPLSPRREWLNSANTTNTTASNTFNSSNNALFSITESIPDNAVLFELCGPLECLELADLSMYPQSKEWLLPFATACRVINVNALEHANDLIHVKMEVLGSLFGNVKLNSTLNSSTATAAAATANMMTHVLSNNFPEGDRSVATLLMRKVNMDLEDSSARLRVLGKIIWSGMARSIKQKLHEPTMLRLQYNKQFEQIRLSSLAKENVESNKVNWQVCVHPTQMLEEGVIKPATWEGIPKKLALNIELFFLNMTRENKVLNDNNTLVLDLCNYTIDYGGKGPRPIRRLVEKHIVNEGKITSMTYEQLVQEVEATSKQLNDLNMKLGLTGTNTNNVTMTTGKAKANNTAAKESKQKGKKTTKVSPQTSNATSSKSQDEMADKLPSIVPLSALPAGSAVAAVRNRM